MSPTIKVTGPYDRLNHGPTGLRGGSFRSEPSHLWISASGPDSARKLLARAPVQVSEEELAVLDAAGVDYQVVSE